MNMRLSEPACITSDGISTTRLFVWLGAVIFISWAALYGQMDRILDRVRWELGGAARSVQSELGSLDHDLGFDRLERAVSGLMYRDPGRGAASRMLKRNWKLPKIETYAGE
jgi:hypothetical protein